MRILIDILFVVVGVASFMPVAAQITSDTTSLAVAESESWDYILSEEIYTSLNSGDAMGLSSMLNASVELSMPQGGSRVYSRKQAEVVLTDFFSTIDEPVFEINHERSIGKSSQTIGFLSGRGVRYRVFILTQLQDTKCMVHQLRFESADK